MTNALPKTAPPRSTLFAVAFAVMGLAGFSGVAPGQGQKGAGVAALGRLEPAGGVVRLGAPSTPDAVSGAAVVTLFVERGSDVQQGQVLAEMDTAGIVKGRSAAARADLETSRRELRAVTSLANEACVLAGTAASRAKRKTELLGRGLASREETELASGDAEAGTASCMARRAAISVAESRIAGEQARVALLEAELRRAFVRAPFAGRVLDVLARPGEIAGLQGVVELGRVDQMYAIAEVYETDIRNIRVGQRARVRSPAIAGELTGTVTRIRPKVQKIDQIGADPAALKDARIIEVEVKLADSKPVADLTNLQVEVEIGR